MQITLRADEGKWLTDGENYGKTISLAKDMSIDSYYEITNAEYKEMIAKEEEADAG